MDEECGYIRAINLEVTALTKSKLNENKVHTAMINYPAAFVPYSLQITHVDGAKLLWQVFPNAGRKESHQQKWKLKDDHKII